MAADEARWARVYAGFRGSKWFLIALTVFIAGWFVWNLALPYWLTFDDTGWTHLNLFLSAEASISVALLIMANDRRDEQQRNNLEQILAAVRTIKSEVEDIDEELNERIHD